MSYNEIIYSVEGSVAVITLNRPEAMNALTHKTHQELRQAITESDKDDSIRVIVLTGAGRGFCSGDDVKVIMGGGEGAGEEEHIKGREEMLKRLQGDYLTYISAGGAPLLTINTPSIAAVNGAAVGSGPTQSPDLAPCALPRVCPPATSAMISSSFIEHLILYV